MLPLKSASYLHCISSPSPTLTTLTYQSPSLLLKKKCYFLWTQDNSYFFRFPREGYFRVIGSRLYFLRAAIGCKYGEFAVKTEIAKFLILSQRKPLRETFSKITIKLFPKNFLFREKPEKSISKALGKKSGSSFLSLRPLPRSFWLARSPSLRFGVSTRLFPEQKHSCARRKRLNCCRLLKIVKYNITKWKYC